MGALAKGISSVIGLSTEDVANNRQKKVAVVQAAQSPQGTSNVEVEEFLHPDQPHPLTEANSKPSTLAVPEGDPSSSR